MPLIVCCFQTLLEAVSVATACKYYLSVKVCQLPSLELADRPDCRVFLSTVTFYEYSTILQALFLTCAVFAGLTAYTFQSKRDFSKMGAGYVSHGCCSLLIVVLSKLLYSSRGNHYQTHKPHLHRRNFPQDLGNFAGTMCVSSTGTRV